MCPLTLIYKIVPEIKFKICSGREWVLPEHISQEYDDKCEITRLREENSELKYTVRQLTGENQALKGEVNRLLTQVTIAHPS
jgi:predicted RNase H-like nuclease (RuvC/YqgF family)